MIELDRKGTHKPWQQCDLCRAISTNAILARCHDVAGILDVRDMRSALDPGAAAALVADDATVMIAASWASARRIV
jgi:hypothetical protein